jgi:hypothetical protein
LTNPWIWTKRGEIDHPKWPQSAKNWPLRLTFPVLWVFFKGQLWFSLIFKAAPNRLCDFPSSRFEPNWSELGKLYSDRDAEYLRP